MDYIFDPKDISHHFVRYCLDMRPPVAASHDRRILQDFANWLIDNFPNAFESLIVKPGQMQVRKSFDLEGKKAETPTFIMTGRGPVFAIPRKIRVDKSYDIDVDSVPIILAAIEELMGLFADKAIVRLNVVNEMVFDTSSVNSVQLVGQMLKNSGWSKNASDVAIRLQIPSDGYNCAVDIKSAALRHTSQAGLSPQPAAAFGVMVTTDISNITQNKKLDIDQAKQVVAFSQHFNASKMIPFLNGNT